MTALIGAVSTTAWRLAGRHVLLWRPGARTLATVNATISAVDYAGNRTSSSTSTIQVRRDNTPPVVGAQLIGHVLFWKARDRLSQHLRGEILQPGGRTQLRDLPPSGMQSVLPGAPPPTWLLVADNSGNTARISLTAPTAAPPRPPPRLPALKAPSREALIWIR